MLDEYDWKQAIKDLHSRGITGPYYLVLTSENTYVGAAISKTNREAIRDRGGIILKASLFVD